MNIAKFLLVIVMLFGWLAIISGFITSLYGVFVKLDADIATVGLIIAAPGLFVCAGAQFMMATIVTAENTTEIKDLLDKLIDQNAKRDTQSAPKLSPPMKRDHYHK